MLEGPNKTKSVEPGSHLKEGAHPIIASLISSKDKDFKKIKQFLYENFEAYYDSDQILDVELESDLSKSKRNNFLSAGPGTYVISSIDSAKKYSRNFIMCTGLLVIGVDKHTGQKISFLSHQFPTYFLYNTTNKNKFASDLRARLEEMKSRCVSGTIDAVVIGGRYLENAGDDAGANVVEDYPASLEVLGEEVKNVFGFEPAVVNGPKTIRNTFDNVYYDTENNRLYLVRPEVKNRKSFVVSDIEKHKDGWK